MLAVAAVVFPSCEATINWIPLLPCAASPTSLQRALDTLVQTAAPCCSDRKLSAYLATVHRLTCTAAIIECWAMRARQAGQEASSAPSGKLPRAYLEPTKHSPCQRPIDGWMPASLEHHHTHVQGSQVRQAQVACSTQRRHAMCLHASARLARLTHRVSLLGMLRFVW